MKEKKDIADLVQEKLEGLNQSTDLPNWDAVANTLQVRERNRKLQWALGSIVCGLILIFGISYLNQSTLPEADSLSDSELKPVEMLQQEANNGQHTSKSAVGQESDPPQKVLPTQKDLEDKPSESKVTVTEFDSIDPSEGATVKTTYYYYRDNDNTEVVTKDVKLIDSLLQESNRRTINDSIPR